MVLGLIKVCISILPSLVEPQRTACIRSHFPKPKSQSLQVAWPERRNGVRFRYSVGFRGKQTDAILPAKVPQKYGCWSWQQHWYWRRDEETKRNKIKSDNSFQSREGKKPQMFDNHLGTVRNEDLLTAVSQEPKKGLRFRVQGSGFRA